VSCTYIESSFCLQSNIRKKWKQVWPDSPFPSFGNNEGVRKKRGAFVSFLKEQAGDVVDIVRDKGAIKVLPRHCTRSQIEQASQQVEKTITST